MEMRIKQFETWSLGQSFDQFELFSKFEYLLTEFLKMTEGGGGGGDGGGVSVSPLYNSRRLVP